ncbi:MAG: effector-associated domain EAD1-containing protein [Cyanobacteria bacterium P01_A01_bin.80]
MSNVLTGVQRKQLREAILGAFTDKSDLEIFLDDIEISLDVIPKGNNDTQFVQNLIKWSENNNKLEELIEGLCEERPNNEELKKIKNKLFSILGYAGIKNSNCPISTEQFTNAFLLFSEIDLDILKRVCKQTMENSPNCQDIFGSFPELINPKSLAIFKIIFIENNYKNKKDVPSIIEFAERLSQEKEVSQDVRDKLNYWVKTVAKELKIKLPTYENKKLFTFTALNSYLLITVTPKSSDTFDLQAELIPNYLHNDTNSERIKLELNSDSPNIECSSSDIVDNIYKFIRIAKTEYLNKYQHHKLKIEIFLPLQFIDANLDLENVPIDFNRKRPFGSEYRLLVRSLDRFISHDGEYVNRLYFKWEKFNHWAQNGIEQTDIQNKIHHISKIDDCNWEEIATELELEEKFGVKITCCLPDNNVDKEDLFIAILRGGVPIFLWTRCNLPNIDDDFNQLLKVDFFQTESTRNELVWRLRKKAHAKQDKENHLGYHLGFLCDNPHRVPFNLMPQNQTLTETDM